MTRRMTDGSVGAAGLTQMVGVGSAAVQDRPGAAVPRKVGQGALARLARSRQAIR
ncbi:MAG: hypothetical protein OIF47_04100 [Marinibacterium sp.]|nr:hypothetical protein [Marinibacterium sp.]